MTHATRVLRVRGVALIIRNPRDEVLILQEFEAKPHFGKYPGMFSPPMETSRKEEQDRSALTRLIYEELPGFEGHVEIEGKRHGVYRVVPGAWVSLYVGRVPDLLLPIPDSRSGKEVGGYFWTPPRNALTLWLRQGAREMLSDYIANRRNAVCRYCRPPTCTRTTEPP